MKFDDWITKESFRTQKEAAEFFGFSVRKLNCIRTLESEPSLADMLLIEEKTKKKVKPQDFINQAKEAAK